MSSDAAEKAALEAQRRNKDAEKIYINSKEMQEKNRDKISSSYRSLARMVVIYYHFITDELLRTVGEKKAEEILKSAIRKWGNWRGKTMREDHQKRDWPLNVLHFIAYYDDFSASQGWTAENVVLSPTEHSKDITFSPYSAMFETLGTGQFSHPFFEEMLTSQTKAYNPAIKVSIPLLMERG